MKTPRWLAGGLLLLLAGAPAMAQRGMPDPQEPSMLTVPRTGAVHPLPTTDAEAHTLLDYSDPLVTVVIRNLYTSYRQQGADVLEAYVQAFTHQQKTRTAPQNMETPQ